MGRSPIQFCCAVMLTVAAGGVGGSESAGAVAAFNLARSARVVTCDPAWREGTKAGRLDEFPAEDLFLTHELPQEADGTLIAREFGRISCIGLEWAERRVLTSVSIALVGPGEIDTERVAVEYWSSQGRSDGWADIGQTPWQGQWARLPASIRREGNQLSISIDPQAVPEFKSGAGTLRIRWLFPSAGKPVRVRELSALSPSAWARTSLRMQTDPPGAAGWTVEAYNGECGASDPGEMKVLYSLPGPSKADRTLLRFRSPKGMFTVAVEDVLAGDGVYVKDYGVYVTRAEGGLSLDEYRRKHAGNKTVLQRVREMPDQTFGQAMKTLWRPIQNNGPTMLSLAADNRKFIVQRTGEILFKTDKEILRVTPRFGARRTRLARLDWGTVGLDTGVVPGGGKGQPLQIKDKKYTKGLGLHAHSQFDVDLNGDYSEFQAEVGVQWQGGGDCGAVTFQVLVDGAKAFDSGAMKQGDAPRPIKIPLDGAKSLSLVASTGADIACAVADWAEARLIRKDGGVEYLGDLYAADRKIDAGVTRKLEGGWLPVLVNSVEVDGVRYTQRTGVVPYDPAAGGVEEEQSFPCERTLCVIAITIENLTRETRPVDYSVLFSVPQVTPPIQSRVAEGRTLFISGERLMVWANEYRPSLKNNGGSNLFHLSGTVPAEATFYQSLFIPGWNATAEDLEEMDWITLWETSGDWDQHWRRMLKGAMEVETPEPLLNDFIRSTQVRCLIAARSEARKEGGQDARPPEAGCPIAPWIAADTYGPLDTEAQAVILGMDLFGHHEFARRCHEFFVNSYNADGLLAKGYTLMGTGQHLWTLAEHVRLTRDDEWLRRLTPELLKPCDWINKQRGKTRACAAGDCPERGLVPPGVLADWNRYAYYMYANGHYQAGLAGVADVLGRIDHPRAGELKQAAAEYRDDILRAYRWNQERMPVVPLRDGTWVPPAPSSLYCFGLTRDFYGGVSATGHDVEVGGNHLVPLGLIDPASRQADWIADYYEDRWFLIDGIFNAYPASENESGWFDRGGFAKLQPHYARTSDLHALRDDVKPFIRTYFNTFPVLLNRENLTYWEHMNNGGAWDKTHESGWFLQMTRTMLLTERGNDLWLAPFVTGEWMKPGKGLSVRNAPTHFGRVSYHLKPVDDRIEASIDPPDGPGLDRIVLRVRHPDGRPMQSVVVNGKKHSDFDPQRETVVLQPQHEPIHVHIEY